MAFEQRDNEGSIFKNDKREKDTHPHGTGKAMIGGVMYYISAWTKDGTKGRFQSLSFKPVDGAPQGTPKPAASKKPAPNFTEADDGPPF